MADIKLPDYNEWKVEDILEDMRREHARQEQMYNVNILRKKYDPRSDTEYFIPDKTKQVIANCFVCKKQIFHDEDYVEIVRYNIITPLKNDSSKRKQFHCDCFEDVAGKDFV